MWDQHDPLCLYCGARLIQRIGRYRIPVSESVERRRTVLADWMAYGHDEAQLRQLAKGPVPQEPAREESPTRKSK